MIFCQLPRFPNPFGYHEGKNINRKNIHTYSLFRNSVSLMCRKQFFLYFCIYSLKYRGTKNLIEKNVHSKNCMTKYSNI